MYHWETVLVKTFSICLGQFNGRQMMSPSTRSNDTMSGISSIAPSKHSSSSHSITSVSLEKLVKLGGFFCLPFKSFFGFS